MEPFIIMLSKILVGIVAIEHLYILWMEMFPAAEALKTANPRPTRWKRGFAGATHRAWSRNV
ncbi:hypothetical protein [Parapedobacter koreensis]|uniref:hypothetical protein n=1 Tax=Parapedobacter koreensis TaxID=332977 RepID=UPI0015A6358B|nr:hypothetical protein [Parapedobacter koreensis]